MAPLQDGLTERWAALQCDMGVEKPEPDLNHSRRWAGAVARGRLLFYETLEVAVGLENIDWSGRHIAHQEWPAQLNRFFCLRHLKQCFLDDHDVRHARLTRMLIEDWIRQHAYDGDSAIAPGDNTLNMSIRLGQSTGTGWWPALAGFTCREVFDDAFLLSVLASTRGQMAYLRAHLAVGSNWRISHLDTLLTCSLLWPDQLGEFTAFAVRNLNEAFHRQIHADGSHEEHTPSYHEWMCQVFTSLWRLSKARPALGLVFDGERVVRMWDYELASMAPDGGNWGINDDGVWNPSPAVAGSRFDAVRARRRAVVAQVGNAAGIWDETREPSRYFREAGQLYLRSGLTAADEMVSFDATRWGGGHCHLARNAISYFSGGRMLLVDPGIFSYETSDPFMAYGKSTPAHNTLNVNSMNQTEANPDVRAASVLPDSGVFCASYEGGFFPGEFTWVWKTGKHPGVSARHTRTLLWIRKRFAVVWDLLRCDDGGVQYGIHWQFPIGAAKCDPATGRAWTCEPEQRNILVECLRPHEAMTLRVASGEVAPRAGWLPLDMKGAHAPAPQVQFVGQMHGREMGTAFLLLPFDGTTPPAVKVERHTNGYGNAEGFTLSWSDGTRDLVMASRELATQIGAAGPIETDAALVAVSFRGAIPVHSIGYGGMYLMLDGRTLVDKRDTTPWSAPVP